MSGGSNLANINKCGLTEILLFVFAVLFGTCTSICSKTMMSMSGTNGTVDRHGELEIEPFQKPLFQTVGMFVGMVFGLVMHWWCVKFKIPFPGYDHGCPSNNGASKGGGLLPTETTSLVGDNGGATGGVEKPEEIPPSMYVLLAIPAAFDLGATALW